MRIRLAAAAGAITLTGCTSTIAGVAVTASVPADSNGAVVALMDTGSYRTVPYPPFGAAGNAGPIVEAARMAAYVVGPWRVNQSLQARGEVEETERTSPLPDQQTLSHVLDDPLADIAAAHGFITGFSSFRTKQNSITTNANALTLQNVVLRFPAADAAADAAAEMAAKLPAPSDGTQRQPLTIRDQPEAVAVAYQSGGTAYADSFTAYGSYVLYQQASTKATGSNPNFNSELLIADAVFAQKKLLDQFEPTDPAKLAELPKDPTGQLLARTLTALDRNFAGMAAGVRRRRGGCTTRTIRSRRSPCSTTPGWSGWRSCWPRCIRPVTGPARPKWSRSSPPTWPPPPT